MFEYYSEDGILTGLIDARETVGIQSKGVYVYNKHFVLNDQENNRAGIGTWCNEQALREIYLRAFELPIIQADAQCVMTAFNRLGAIWAGAYTELLTDWLRGEAVTDMYDGTYMVKVNEIVAGNDLPDNFVGEDISELKDYGPDGAKANPMVAQALRTSAKRVLNTVVNSRGMDGISQYTRVVSDVVAADAEHCAVGTGRADGGGVCAGRAGWQEEGREEVIRFLLREFSEDFRGTWRKAVCPFCCAEVKPLQISGKAGISAYSDLSKPRNHAIMASEYFTQGGGETNAPNCHRR